jgi:hypothetical protein
MAGDWIKMRGNLWDDPRVASICDATDQTEATVIGGLYWLWATADQHTESGVMLGLSLRQIDRKTGIQGFGQALCDVGWLADHPEGVRITRFEEHNGTSAKKRCQTAKRVAEFRSGNADVTKHALPTDDDGVMDALAREREREEIKERTLPPARKRAVVAEVSVEDLTAAGFDEATAADFIAHKKRLKAPLTPRAWDDHVRESAKAGLSPLQAAEKVMAKGWKGFDASYVAGRHPPAEQKPSPATELWKPPPIPTAAERAASEEARKRVMQAIKVVQ